MVEYAALTSDLNIRTLVLAADVFLLLLPWHPHPLTKTLTQAILQLCQEVLPGNKRSDSIWVEYK